MGALTIRKESKMLKKIISLFYGKKNENLKKEIDNAISFKQGFDLTELPVVTLYCGDRKLNFLLDTGSNNCIIDSNALKDIQYENIDDESELFGIDGNIVRTKMCRIKLTYKNTDYEFDYIINDMSQCFGNIKKDTGVTLHGLIGSSFFNKFKYVLDFEELIAYSKL